MDTYQRILLQWQSWNVRTGRDLSHRMNDAYIACYTESNNIESEEVDEKTSREVFLFGTVHYYTGSLLVLTELANAAMCHQLLCKRFGEQAPMTVDFVREVHATMMAGCYDRRRYIDLEERPGSFKKHDFIVGKDEVGVDPEDVEEELALLLEEMEDSEDVHPLLAGTYLHAKFECIHPFADGNGRVGRLLLNYWLVTHNHPPITVYNEDKQEYFDALQAYVDFENLTPLVNFLMEQTVKTWCPIMPNSQ